MRAQGAASVQSQRAAGEASRQQRELARDETILGMRMGETAANQQMVADNNAMIMSGIGNVASAGMQFAGGMPMKRRPKRKTKKAKKK